MKNLIHSYLDHSSYIIKNYWLENVFSEKECDRHLSGDFHIHDLDNLCPYCIGWDTSTILHNKKRHPLKPLKMFLILYLSFWIKCHMNGLELSH